jgi:hypothetical protein
MKKFWLSCLALSFCLSFTSTLLSYKDTKDCLKDWNYAKIYKSNQEAFQKEKDSFETCLVEDNWGITGTFFGDHQRASDRIRQAKSYDDNDKETKEVLEEFQDNVSWRANAQWKGKWTTILGGALMAGYLGYCFKNMFPIVPTTDDVNNALKKPEPPSE